MCNQARGRAKAHVQIFRPCQVFTTEEESYQAVLEGRVKPGTCMVLMYEGPKGGPGMPEMYKTMKYLEGMGLSDTCA